MRENVAFAVAAAALIVWACSYVWIRGAVDGRTVLTRFAYTLAVPITGFGAAAIVLRGFASWPYLMLVAAGALFAAVAIRRLARHESAANVY